MSIPKLTGKHGPIKEILPIIRLFDKDVRVQKIRPERKNDPDNLSAIDPDNDALIYVSSQSGGVVVCVVDLGNIAQIINITCSADIDDLVEQANSKLVQNLKKRQKTTTA